MKKLIYVLSAIATAFAGTASADVSVSGTGQTNYTSSGTKNYTSTSGSVKFALSTTTASGMTISTAAGITTDLEGTAADDTTGLTSLTFVTGGATIVIGQDVAAPQIGGVGGVASDLVDQNHQTINAAPAIGTDADQDGNGITITTAVGAGTLTAAYVWDDTPNTTGGQGDFDSNNQSMGLSFSMPAGAATVTVGHSTSADASSENDTMTGATLAYPVGGGTLSVGYKQTTGEVKADAVSAAFAMSLDADTSFSVGYNTASEGAQSAQTTEAKITRAIGGGASVFAELKNSTGNSSGVTKSGTQSTSTFAIGTSVAF